MANIDVYSLTLPNDDNAYWLKDKSLQDAKGAANGIAELDSGGKVPSSQLPSYVDDVIEVTDYSHLPITGETGKIYVTLDDNKTYRWSGSAYVEISESLALGETSSTAYAGDKGKTNADNITTIQGLIPSNATTSNKLATANDIPDISGKADKVTSATNGNLAGLNASGNLTDSGVAANNIVKKSGDTMTGTFTVQTESIVPTIYLKSPAKENVGRAVAGIQKNTSSITDNGIRIADYTWGESTKKSSFVIQDNANLASKVRLITTDANNVSTTYKIFGEHNSNVYNNTDKGKVDKIDETTTSISGNPISITGLKSNQLAVNPVITFEPIQAGSGDPSPSNVRAISGYDKIEVLSCGKNILKGDKWAYNSQNVFLGATGENDYRHLLLSGTYTLSVSTTKSGSTLYYAINDGASTLITSPFTFTVSNRAYYRFWVTNSNGITPSDITLFQLEQGSSATTYSPYHKTTDLSENLPQTVYGGSLDLRNGKLIITHAKKRMNGNDTFGGSNPGTNAQLQINDMKSGIWSDDGKTVCDSLEKSDGIIIGKTTILIGGNNNVVYIYNMSLVDASINSSATLNAYLANHPIEFTYPLGTPIEIQLTPHEISLLKDYAYVSTNGTNIQFDYHNGELASLADVSQLGETVNELGAKVLSFVRLSYSFGTVINGTRYTFEVTNNYSYLNRNTVKAITIYSVKGSSGADAEGIYNQNFGIGDPNKLFINYNCKMSQSNAVMEVDILYLA